MSIYYFDSENGSDKNNGLSEQTPFASVAVVEKLELQAGDKLLLHCGQTFAGQMTVTGCGTPENPIVIATYGFGGKPCIAAEAAPYAVGLFGDGIELSGLEITNKNGLRGVYLKKSTAGAAVHLYVRGCHIHDIITDGIDHCQGGIIIDTTDTAPAWYEDVRLENNKINNVHRSGIFVNSQWVNRDNAFCWGKNEYIDDEHGWFPHKNVYIAGNQVDYPGGDGIVAIACLNLTMEFNRVYHANSRAYKEGANAGIWPMNSKNALIQYNEVAYTFHPFGGDGMAYDIDNLSEGTIVQYNYSHHNEGGFMLVCNNSAEDGKHYRRHHDNIIRNNLSVNDATRRDDPIFTIVGPLRDLYIVNNTIYKEDENRFRLFEVSDYSQTGISKDVHIFNNIFASKYPNCWNHFVCNGTYTFDTNLFWGMEPPEGENVVVKNALKFNPLFSAEGDADCGRDTGYSYVPVWQSQANVIGKEVEVAAEEDYFGTKASDKHYLGAFVYVKK